MSDIRIVAPADPADAAFLAADDYAPFLQFGTHPDHGKGWTLWYIDEDGRPESHFIPGGLTDSGWALTRPGSGCAA